MATIRARGWLVIQTDGGTAALSTSGDYWVKRARIEPSPAALDASLAESLWSASADLADLDADALVAASGAARADLEHTTPR